MGRFSGSQNSFFIVLEPRGNVSKAIVALSVMIGKKAQQSPCCAFYHDRKHSKALVVLSIMIESMARRLLCFLS